MKQACAVKEKYVKIRESLFYDAIKTIKGHGY